MSNARAFGYIKANYLRKISEVNQALKNGNYKARKIIKMENKIYKKKKNNNKEH